MECPIRMESNGEVGKVNISQATYQLLEGNPQFAFESRGQIEAKGKGVNNKRFELIFTPAGLGMC